MERHVIAKMSENFLTENRRILIACALLLLLTMQRHTAMFAIIFAVPVLIWLIYSIFVICAKPKKRKHQLIKVTIWLLTAFIILAVHWYRSEATRQSADDIVFALKKYKAEHDVYPASLDVIGQDSQRLKKEFMLHYWLDDGKPTLLYSSVLHVFDKFDYDFQTNAWIFRPD